MWDTIENKEYLGGAPLNFAAHFVKCGGEASIISTVGNDMPVVAAKIENDVGSFVVGRSGPIPEYSDELKLMLAPAR